jgi:hypothetical protein
MDKTHGENPVPFGRITGIVVIDNEDWNMAEVINNGGDLYATFPLTEDNMNKYVEGGNSINLETIEEVQGKL